MCGLSRIGAHPWYRVGSTAESGKITVQVETRAGWIVRYRCGHERSALEEHHSAEFPAADHVIERALLFRNVRPLPNGSS